MNKPHNPVIKKEYAEKFRQNPTNLSTSGGSGASVAPPCVTRHMIANSGKPESGKK